MLKERTVNDQFQSGGGGETREFTVNVDADIMDMLSDLYSDPELAVIRETLNNAWDAHIEAGNVATPIMLHLPNQLEPFFTVRDFGTGMSHDFVMRNFNTYGLSTKDKSNAFNGTFGIGSKSFLACTSLATITVFYEGERRVYTSYRDADGMPKTTHQHTEPTAEPNGVEITYPVSSDRFSRYLDAAQTFLKRFDHPVDIRGNKHLDIKRVKYVLQGNGWALRERESVYAREQLVALMGNVAYPVDIKRIRETLSSNGESTVAQLTEVGFDLIFNIGELSIPPSRENLKYTDKTIMALCNKLRHVADELVANAQAKFDKCKTKWEAALLYNEITDGQHYRFNDLIRSRCRFQGEPIEAQVVWNRQDTDKIQVHIADSYSLRRKTVNGLKWTSRLVIDPKSPPHFVVDDLKGYRVWSRLHHWPDRGNRDVILINVGDPRTILDQVEAPADFPITMLSELPEPPKAKRNSNGRTIAKIFKWNPTDDRWSKADVDPEDGGIFIRLNNWDKMDSTGKYNNILHRVWEDAVGLGVINKYKPIYGIPDSHKSIWSSKKTGDGWEHFDTFVKREFKKYLDANDPARAMANYEELRQVDDSEIVRWAQQFRQYEWWPTKKRSPMAKLMRYIGDLEANQTKKGREIKNLLHIFDMKLPERKPVRSLGPVIGQVKKTYPLLRSLPQTSNEQRNAHVFQYIEAID